MAELIFEPGSPGLESNALTTRPTRYYQYGKYNQVIVQIMCMYAAVHNCSFCMQCIFVVLGLLV
jgi:hypothetical protein